jgi:hypothetical protein
MHESAAEIFNLPYFKASNGVLQIPPIKNTFPQFPLIFPVRDGTEYETTKCADE